VYNIACFSFYGISSINVCVVETIPFFATDRVPENVHQIGTAAIVVQITGTNWPQPHYTLLAHGLCRFAIKQVLRDTPYLMAQVSQLTEICELSTANAFL